MNDNRNGYCCKCEEEFRVEESDHSIINVDWLRKDIKNVEKAYFSTQVKTRGRSVMKNATISELKNELSSLDEKKLVEILIRVAKYKKENKELLSYLLFDAHDEVEYINSIKKEITDQFNVMNKSNIYFAKKTIRKALRIANKYIKYSGKKETEAELLIFFCNQLNESGLDYKKSVAMDNLFKRQIERIKKAISTLHEDLQYDYKKEIEKLNNQESNNNLLKRIFRKNK